MKNVLITGGAGFIGSHLVDNLRNENKWRITIVDNFNDFYSPQVKKANIQKHLSDPDIRVDNVDICDFNELHKIFAEQNFDLIVHLAARAGVRPSLEQPLLYAETNIRGTLNLLELAREFSISQFIFGSSSSVYGANAKIPFHEKALVLSPISPYAATKASGELLCHTYSHLYNMRAVCLRFFTVYGARQRPDLAIHKFARLISEDKPIQVFGDGTSRRDYTFIDDIIAGVQAAINYTETPFEIFNLGESRTTELRYLITLLEENLGKRAIIEQCQMQAGDMPATFADISKARTLLGYNPKTMIEVGIEKFVEWFLEQNKSVQTNSQHQNYRSRTY
jgi:UDP-glucuronate 4-epimerase